MKITVRVFGRYKDIVGRDTVELNITTGNTLRDVIEIFIQLYPLTEKDKSRIMVTKNKMYASFDTPVSEEDVITLAPPVVSGG